HRPPEPQIGGIVVREDRPRLVVDQRDLRGRRCFAVVVARDLIVESIRRVLRRAGLHVSTILNRCTDVTNLRLQTQISPLKPEKPGDIPRPAVVTSARRSVRRRPFTWAAQGCARREPCVRGAVPRVLSWSE